jgi:hypothetical protein
MIFSKFGNFFLKSKVFTKDNVKYDFENKKIGVLRTGYGPNAAKRTLQSILSVTISQGTMKIIVLKRISK